MFYVREKESHDPRDGQDVSEVLKEKIENEEGFFEFRMLKVDPYSKCGYLYFLLFIGVILAYSLGNSMTLSRVR